MKKIAFAYAHGGPVFDKESPDGFNERGRNLTHSILSAIRSGADMVFVSESVYPHAQSEVEKLFKKGVFKGVEHLIDLAAYPIEKKVKFPKNYLMNRGAQRADGFFGIIFPDSDVLFPRKFPKVVARGLKKIPFLQPDKVTYLDPNHKPERDEEFAMKRYIVEPKNRKLSYNYIEGMPGMVNIVRREDFLDIGGYSQAISGVNWEDVEYQIRLKMLGKKMSYLPEQVCYHIYHSRGAKARKAENLPSMYLENSNFMNWLIHNCFQIQDRKYNRKNFKEYLELIVESLEQNKTLKKAYSNETGTITPGFDPAKRYEGFLFGLMEPYSELASVTDQVHAVRKAANFWGSSDKDILMRNKEYWGRPYAITFRHLDQGKMTRSEVMQRMRSVTSFINKFADNEEELERELEKMTKEEKQKKKQDIEEGRHVMERGRQHMIEEIEFLGDVLEKGEYAKPKLVILVGYPTAGKTVVARFLTDHLFFTPLNADAIAVELFGHGHPFKEDEEPQKIIDTIYKERNELLEEGKNVVIWAIPENNEIRKRMLSTKTDADKFIVWLKINQDTLRERLEIRTKKKIKNTLVLIGGPPASGKSTIAQFFRERLNFELLSLDEVLIKMFGHGHGDFKEGEDPVQALQYVYKQKDVLLKQGKNVVIEGIPEDNQIRKDMLTTPCDVERYFIDIRVRPEVLTKRMKERDWAKDELETIFEPPQNLPGKTLTFDNSTVDSMEIIRARLLELFGKLKFGFEKPKGLDAKILEYDNNIPDDLMKIKSALVKEL